jgi:hypothetical protein
MSVADDLIELRKMEAVLPEIDATGLEALPTFASVFAYIAAAAHAGRNAADDVEVLARFAEMSAPEVRMIAASLRQLGFKTPADRLAEVAGRRKTSLRPLA